MAIAVDNVVIQNISAMTTMQHFQRWGATHPLLLTILRIGLGLILTAKGINFMRDSNLLDRLLYGGESLAQNQTHWLPIIISWANLLGGFMLIIGLWTRVMALLQLPILVGAIVFINVQKSGFAPEGELAMAIGALILAIFFLLEGSGRYSADGYFDRNRGPQSHGQNLP
jgi:putative oxidoreductase